MKKFWYWYSKIDEPWKMIFAFTILMFPVWIGFILTEFGFTWGFWISALEIPFILSKIYYDNKSIIFTKKR